MTSKRWALACLLGACGGGQSPDGTLACTPDDQAIPGLQLVVTPVELGTSGTCPSGLLRSTADAMAAFPEGVPPELATVDYSTTRVVLGASNPVLQFAVDDGTQLIVGEEPLCQGIAPRCVAYVVRGTTQDTLQIFDCPYRGPEPCNAP